jgi:hypothetical protein
MNPFRTVNGPCSTVPFIADTRRNPAEHMAATTWRPGTAGPVAADRHRERPGSGPTFLFVPDVLS